MKTKYNKGYMITDILLSIICIIILSLPLIKTFYIITNQENLEKENKTLINVLKIQEEFIISSNSKPDIEKDRVLDDYLIKTKLEKEFSEKISKYRVYIYKGDILQSEFNIIKHYE